MSRWCPGYTPVWLPCGSRNPQCLQALYVGFRIPHSFSGIPRTLLPNPILLPGQQTRLAKAWPALHLRSRDDTGILLFVAQCLAVILRGGAQTRPPLPLARCPWVSRFDPKAPELLPAQHVPDPVAAAPALEGRVNALSCKGAQRTAAAPARSQ
jgi:hypothetical protein